MRLGKLAPLAAGLVLALSWGGVALASTPSTPTSAGGVTPYLVDDPGPGGNVACSALGYEHSSARANYNEGSFDAAFPAGISVTTGGTYVSWTSTFGIGAVIVKGSNAANIYEYSPASLGDSGLASPTNASGGPAGLSNLTFCWDGEEEPDDPRIIVEKVAANAPEGYHFEFEPSWGDNFFLGHLESEDSGALEPGVYSVSEIVPEGFVLAGVVCDDGSLSSAINLEAGETVTCTFTNRMVPDEEEESGNIVVVKETLPDGSPVAFEFQPSWELNFLLSDGGSHDSGRLAPGTYSVGEINLPAGWLLDSAVCDDGSDPAAIELSAGETVTCTFTNSQEQVLGPDGSLTIIKMTNPAGGEGFAFTTSENLSGAFTLDDGGSMLFGGLEPGAYTVTEADPGADWAFQSVQCQALDWSADGRSVTVDLAEGEAAVCTFYNIAELPFTGSPSWLWPLLVAGLGALLLGTGLVLVPAVRRLGGR